MHTNLINRLIVWIGIPLLRFILRIPETFLYLSSERRDEIRAVLADYDRKIL